MMTEPTRPMTDDSRLVTVWVSIVRTSVTSLDRRDTSSPTRRPAWKSSDRVTRRPNRSPRSWATTRSPTTPSRYVWRKLPTAWTQNSDEQDDDEPIEAGRSPPATTCGGDPGDDQREGEPDEADDRTSPTSAIPNRRQVRSQVVEQAAPRHAAEAADLADDGARVGRHAGELLGHAPMMAPTAARPTRSAPARRSRRDGVRSRRRTRSRSGCRDRCGSPSAAAATASGRR